MQPVRNDDWTAQVNSPLSLGTWTIRYLYPMTEMGRKRLIVVVSVLIKSLSLITLDEISPAHLSGLMFLFNVTEQIAGIKRNA